MISALRLKERLFGVAFLTFFFVGLPSAGADLRGKEGSLVGEAIPILLYHRFGPVLADSMTVTTNVLESQLKYLRENSYTVIPLRHLIEYHFRKRQTLPCRSVVITVDDGHKTVYTDLFPLLKKYRLPATLFLYPSPISNASYAMTWTQIRDMMGGGLIDLQGHTYWHPNFKNEKKKLSSVEYEKFVAMQFRKSKEKLEKELDIKVDMLAWPFGIYDEDLIGKAGDAGYVAAFGMERHHANGSDNVMALPRYLISDADRGKAFGRIVAGLPCS